MLNSGFKVRYVFAAIIVLLIIGGGLFYWFQYRPSEVRRSCAEIATKLGTTSQKNNSYKECLAKQGFNPESLFEETNIDSTNDKSDTSQIESSIDDIKSSVQDSLDEQQNFIDEQNTKMQDEINNQANCESNGGRYQGNGMCVYY